MRQLPAYFDNPELCAGYLYTNGDVKWQTCMFTSRKKQLRVIGFSLMLRVKLPVGLQVTNI